MNLRLFVVASTFGGGTGSHLVRLLDELASGTDHAPSGTDGPQPEPIRLLTHDPAALAVPERVELIDDSGRGPLHRFPLAQLRQFRRLLTEVRAHRPHVVHAYFYWPIVYGRLLKRIGAIPALVENREDAGFDWSPTDYRVLRASAGVPDRIVCVSESVRRVVLEKEGVPPERVVVIRNGVPLPPLDALSDREPALRAELGLEEGDLVVGMVANLNRAVKGVHHFVDAMPRIVEQVPRARFVIVGDGPDRPELEARVRRLGQQERVVFAGFRSDVERFYRIMDLSVLTSLSEGLSITILESMSFGLPVVATRVGGNPELVEEGVSGLLVPPADPGRFADAVARVLRDATLRRRMGRAGRRRAESEFAMARVAEQYRELYGALTLPPMRAGVR